MMRPFVGATRVQLIGSGTPTSARRRSAGLQVAVDVVDAVHRSARTCSRARRGSRENGLLAAVGAVPVGGHHVGLRVRGMLEQLASAGQVPFSSCGSSLDRNHRGDDGRVRPSVPDSVGSARSCRRPGSSPSARQTVVHQALTTCRSPACRWPPDAMDVEDALVPPRDPAPT